MTIESQNKYTIAIPAYKSLFLKECIQSILDQTNRNFELLILNDASPNPIKEVVETFEDSRISYFENKINVGGVRLVENWNTCLQKARGEFVMIMGDDDRLEPDYLEVFDAMIDKNPDLDVFHCRSLIIDEEGKAIELSEPWPERETLYQNIWLRMNGSRQAFISDFVYRKSKLEEIGGFQNLPYAWGSDDLTAFKAIGKSAIAHTNKPIFHYRRSRHTITSIGGIDKKMEATLLFENEVMNNLLITPPTTNNELVVYGTIQKNWARWMQQKRMYWLAKSFLQTSIFVIIQWAWKRKKYNVNFVTYLAAIATFFKYKLSKKAV